MCVVFLLLFGSPRFFCFFGGGVLLLLFPDARYRSCVIACVPLDFSFASMSTSLHGGSGHDPLSSPSYWSSTNRSSTHHNAWI